jgi:hypothetical protein
VEERKKLNETTELILGWSVERLAKAGSLNRLLRCGIHLADGLPRGLRDSSAKRQRGQQSSPRFPPGTPSGTRPQKVT